MIIRLWYWTTFYINVLCWQTCYWVDSKTIAHDWLNLGMSHIHDIWTTRVPCITDKDCIAPNKCCMDPVFSVSRNFCCDFKVGGDSDALLNIWGTLNGL